MSSSAQPYLNAGPDYNNYGDTTVPTTPQVNPIPLFKQVQSYGDGNVGFISDVDNETLNPRTIATATVTLGGSATTGDTAFIEISAGIFKGNAQQASTLVVAGDTLATIAARLVDAINSNPAFQKAGITAELNVVSSNQVISVYWPGPVSQLAVIQGYANKNSKTITYSGSVTVGDTCYVTIANANSARNALIALSGSVTTSDVNTVTFSHPALSNGTKAITYTSAGGNTLSDVASGLATAINGDSTLSGLGIVATAVGANLFLTWGVSANGLTASFAASRAATETLTAAAVAGSAPSYLGPAQVGSYTITVGGSATTGDIVSATIYCASMQNPITVQYTVQGGDTTALIAQGLANAINASTQLDLVSMTAVRSGSVLTITWLQFQSGAVSMKTAVRGVSTEAGTTTSPVLSRTVSYLTITSDTTTLIATGIKNAINADPILAQWGIPATSSGAVVTILYNGNLRPMTISTSFSSGATEAAAIASSQYAPTATIGGTITAGDKVGITVNSGEFLDGAQTVTYTVVGGDTTTTIAAALVALLNQVTDMVQNGYSCSNSGAVITFAAEGTDPNLTVTAPAVTGAATETVTIGTSGTVGTETFTVVAFTGGSGPICVTKDFRYQNGANVESFNAGRQRVVDYNTLKNLVSQGAPVL